MYSKAIFKYYLDINMFNVPFSLIFAFTAGILWSAIIFSSFGIFIGYLGYQTFKKNEYYAYFNLGITKTNLLKRVCSINIMISFLLILIYLIIR